MLWRDRIFLIFLSVITTLVVLAVAGVVGVRMLAHDPGLLTRALSLAGVSTHTHEQSSYSHGAGDVVADMVERANPAVIAITVSKEVPRYEQYFHQYRDPFDVFGFSIPRMRQNGFEKREVGGGSGFLVSADGYIVTNRHVVDDEEAEYAVFLNDGTRYDARVIARDRALDIAVVKIDGEHLPFLELGDSDTMRIGETVIAIGNALAEYRNTVSVGVVSGLSRSIVAGDGMGSSETLDQLIQTDAAINPGNSGGPLLNLAGHVIGINVAVASGAENIGFALASNSMRGVIDSVRETGEIVRPFLGVRYLPITKEIQAINELPVDYGVLVQRGSGSGELAVIPGSPADKTGIVENDIILEFNGARLDERASLSSRIRGARVGDTIELTVLHRGEQRVVSVVLEEMKDI